MDSIKCKLLETRNNEYRQKNKELQQQLKHIEMIASERSEPTELYYKEIEYTNNFFKTKLENHASLIQDILKLPPPQSFNDLKQNIFPKLKLLFLSFIKKINNYTDYLKTCWKGPIISDCCNKINLDLEEKLKTTINRFNYYCSILNTSKWTSDLPEHNSCKTQFLDWLNKATDIMKEFIKKLQPLRAETSPFVLDDTDF